MPKDQLAGGSVFTYEVPPGEPFSEGVLRAVSAASGADPVPGSGGDREESLDPLYTAVDPDALDSVFRTGDPETDADGRITFTYHRREVTVHSEGRITVRRPPVAGETAD